MVIHPGEFVTKELSVWVVADSSTEQGRQMVLDAMSYLVRCVYVYVYMCVIV